ncbi:hypothetical protein FRB95_001639, partial [Tulasnella sp. JGI-2019a]
VLQGAAKARDPFFAHGKVKYYPQLGHPLQFTPMSSSACFNRTMLSRLFRKYSGSMPYGVLMSTFSAASTLLMRGP